MKRTYNLLIAIPFLLAGCSDDNTPDNSSFNTASTITLSRAEADATEGINNFGWRSFEAISSIENNRESNTIVSPLGVSMALSMVANGVGLSTQEEIVKTIVGTSGTLGELNSLNQKIVEGLPTIQQASTIVLKNSLWTVPQTLLTPEFRQTMSEFYYASYFNANKDKLKENINSWVKESTYGVIPQYLTEFDSEFMAINVIYLKGLWESPFDTKLTKDDIFVCKNGTKSTRPMMHNTITTKYYEDENMQICNVAYKQKAFSMAVILPKTGQLLDMTLFADGTWHDKLSQAPLYQVDLELPKFKFEYAAHADTWESAMKSIGIKSLFETGLDNLATDQSGLIKKINNIDLLQKCVIDVDEEGSKIAAATSISGGETSAGPLKTVVMKADHPFLFVIYEHSTGIILFIGEVNNL